MSLIECQTCGKKKFNTETWICLECGRWRRPKALQDLGIPEPPVNELIKNQEFWKNKTMTYLGDKKYFDQDIRTGVCYFCKKENRVRKTGPTSLHHVKYDHSDPLAWTIEVCSKCHWQIDPNNRKVIAKSTGKEIERPYGKYDGPYYENKEEKMKREERDRKDWYKSFCMNMGGGEFVPIKELIPNREFYDKVMNAIEKEKTASKKDTMSNVSRRYY